MEKSSRRLSRGIDPKTRPLEASYLGGEIKRGDIMNHNRLLLMPTCSQQVVTLFFTLVGPWAKRGDSFGVFSSDGGTGFGIIGFIFRCYSSVPLPFAG
ncbi:MAG: hypothetical protein CM15mP49_16760 [Actinomycetota bacterium]|nr:MAG: hypothetical protein CM15mP49_16760 [Actinomycetota bacterium]